MNKKSILHLFQKELPLGVKTFFLNLFLIIVSIFITCVLIEIFYRIYDRLYPPVAVMTQIGPKFNPGTSGDYLGGKTSIDSYGFRNGFDPDIWNRKRKVMMIGDSVGFGISVDDNQTISYLLNVYFKDADVGFLNLCNPGWDTVLLRGRLFQYGAELAPWELIIWMYYINDAKYSVNYFPLEKIIVNKPSPFEQLSLKDIFLFKWPTALKERIIKHRLSKQIANDPVHSSWDDYYHWCLSSYEPGSATRLNEEAFIKDIVLWAKNNGTKIVFVVFPAENQLNDGNRVPQEFLLNLGKQENFPVLDLLPYLTETNKNGKVYLPEDHQHLNAYGNKIVSDLIKEWLIQIGYFKPVSSNKSD